MSDEDYTNSPLASALGIVLDEDNAKTEQEKKRALAAKQSDIDRANTDANFAREILYDTEVKTQEAIENLMQIAGESMSARHYEVLAALLANRAQNAERFLKIHADKQKVQNNAINLERNKALVPPPPTTGNTNIQVNNPIVFSGTTAEFLDMLRVGSPTLLLDQSVPDPEAD